MDTTIVKETFKTSEIMDADALLDNIQRGLDLGQEHHVMGMLFQLVKQNTEDLKKLKKEQVIQVVKDTSAVKRLGTPTSAFDLRVPSSEVSVISKPAEREVSILFVPSLTYARTLRNELTRLVKEIDKAFGFDRKKKA
jgi:hypothetical protein